MNKTELVNSIAEKAELSKIDAKKALDAFIESVNETLKGGDKITLPGLGVFSVTEKAERTGVNPRTKEALIIPAHKVVKFKAGSELSNSVK